MIDPSTWKSEEKCRANTSMAYAENCQKTFTVVFKDLTIVGHEGSFCNPPKVVWQCPECGHYSTTDMAIEEYSQAKAES